MAASPAPLPPRRSRLLAGASSAMNTHWSAVAPLRCAPVEVPGVTSTAMVTSFGEIRIQKSEVQVGFEPAAELLDRHAPEQRLVHAVAVANGDLVVLERLEVDRDAEWR